MSVRFRSPCPSTAHNGTAQGPGSLPHGDRQDPDSLQQVAAEDDVEYTAMAAALRLPAVRCAPQASPAA